jgi:DNA-binding LytR/AlgR family response regulator
MITSVKSQLPPFVQFGRRLVNLNNVTLIEFERDKLIMSLGEKETVSASKEEAAEFLKALGWREMEAAR